MPKGKSKPASAAERSKTRNTLSVTKPVSAWNKPLKTDFKKLFVSLSKATTDGLLGKWENLGIDLVESAATLGLKSEPGQVAWILINNALSQSIFQLVEEYENELEPIQKKNINKFNGTLDFELEKKRFTINEKFFTRPSRCSILKNIQKPFRQWLEGYIEKSESRDPNVQALSIAGRLPSYFVNNLHQEWARCPDFYQPVLDAVESPFTKANAQERSWQKYESWLDRQIDVSVFNESFGLRQIYVPLRGFYKRRSEKDVDKARLHRETAERHMVSAKDIEKIAVDLKAEVISWIKKSDREDAVRLISGGPGSGKSCFTKILATHIVESSLIRALYIPLHQFDHKDDLVESVGNYFKQTEIFENNPIDTEAGEDCLLIIFDGLDELAMQGKFGAEAARLFVEEVDRTVRRRNSNELRLLVLITGRDLSIQSTENEFREEGQILHVLPYFVPEEERGSFKENIDLLEEDARDLWWKKYGNVTGKKYETMPKELQREEFNDITPQPLLNYLVALSYERGKLDFKGEINLNEIYYDLLGAVHERGYESQGKRSGTHASIRQMSNEDFAAVLQEIALATWHGDGRTTTIKEIRKHCETSGLSHLLDTFEEGAEKGVTRLLTAFYFRQYGARPEGDRTFEFTHKSFGEFLTSQRIVRGIQDISEELERRSGGNYRAWDEIECLKRWIELCGPSKMDKYLLEFIRREIQLAGKENAIKWQESLQRLINHLLKEGMPMQTLDPRPNYLEETRQARNAEEALLVSLNTCARVTKRISKINWPNRNSIGNWIRKLESQRPGYQNEISSGYFSWLDLSYQNLEAMDLFEANLSNSNLSGIQGSLSVLWHSNLDSADLKGAVINKAMLDASSLRWGNLEGAKLEETNFERADLRETNFKGANLKRANLKRANLEGAMLEGANLELADLRNTNLSGADLRGANLEGARLEDARLEGTRLKKAKLKDTILEKK